jgi:hypothetical protein
VQESVEPGHVAGDEAPVLVHRVAAQRRGAGLGEAGEELERLPLGLGLAHARGAHLVGQPALAVVAGAPLVHCLEHRVGLVHHEVGALGDDLEPGVGDDGGDLEDATGVGVEPRHLHVDPHQRGRLLARRCALLGHR